MDINIVEVFYECREVQKSSCRLAGHCLALFRAWQS